MYKVSNSTVQFTRARRLWLFGSQFQKTGWVHMCSLRIIKQPEQIHLWCWASCWYTFLTIFTNGIIYLTLNWYCFLILLVQLRPEWQYLLHDLSSFLHWQDFFPVHLVLHSHDDFTFFMTLSTWLDPRKGTICVLINEAVVNSVPESEILEGWVSWVS